MTTVSPHAADPRRAGFIYYGQYRDSVKVGFTSNLRQRQVALKCEIVALEAGTLAVEWDRHDLFAPWRIKAEFYTLDVLQHPHVAALPDPAEWLATRPDLHYEANGWHGFRLRPEPVTVPPGWEF